MKRSPSASPEPQLVMFTNDRNVEMANCVTDDNVKASSSETTEQESVKLLREIRDLLSTRVDGLPDSPQSSGDGRSDADRENEDNWMLAAAVLDRIFTIVITVVYVVSNVVFFFRFRYHTHDHND